MDRVVYLNSLFDLYENLLTDKEKDCFLDYYSNDLSLAEIAENNNVSRNAIHKTVKTVEEKLEEYEKNVGFYKLKSDLKNITKLNDLDEIKKAIETLL